MAFYVGQKVVAVRGGTRGFLKRGAIYTISGICPARRHLDKKVGYFVCEAKGLEDEITCDCFDGLNFRPVVERKTDISIFTALLDPANHKHLEGV